MGDPSEDMYRQKDTCGSDASRITDDSEEDSNQLRQRRQGTAWSTCSDTTECSVKTGSTQPEDVNFEDSFCDSGSCRDTLTFDEAWYQKNMPHNSLSDSPLHSKEQYPYPKQDQDYHFPHEKPNQAPLTTRLYTKSTKAQETIPEDCHVPFESSRETNQTLTKRRDGAELSRDPTNGTRKHASELNLPRSPFVPTELENQTPLPTSLKRPALPPKPSQRTPDHTWPTKARHNRQLPLPTTDHYAQIQHFQTPEAPQERGPPALPPKPSNAHLKPSRPPKPNSTALPPPRIPKRKPETFQPAPPLEPEQNMQQRPLLLSRPRGESNRQWLPPRSSSRHGLQPLSVSQGIHPIASPDQTGNRLLSVQSRLEIQSSNLISQQRQPATPTASDSSEERTESTASLTHQSQTSNRTPPGQPIRRAPGQRQRRPHFILSIRNLLIASFISVLISLASMSFLICMQLDPFNFTWRDRIFKEGVYRTCVKCMFLIQDLERDLSNPDFKVLVNEKRDGEMYCCARTSEEMRSLLKLMLREPRQPGAGSALTNSEVTEQSVPSAHIKLYPGDQPSYFFGPKENIMTHNEKETHQHHNHVTVATYGLNIESPGYYYVYSSITYAIEASRCSDGTVKNLEHKILMVRPSFQTDNGILAKTAHSCCVDCSDGDKQSSFAGGVFLLKKGDQIATSVTNMTVVKFDVSSYLGVVMLGR